MSALDDLLARITGQVSIKNQGGVNAAYQKMMQYGAQADADTGVLGRNLATNLEASQKNRFNSLLNQRQSANDRGMLNSGATLNQQQLIGTGYDTADTSMNSNNIDSLSSIARRRLEMQQGLDDSILEGGRLTTQDQTDAQSATLAAQATADELKRQNDLALAALVPQAAAAQAPADYSMTAQAPSSYAPAAAQVLAAQRTAPIPAYHAPVPASVYSSPTMYNAPKPKPYSSPTMYNTYKPPVKRNVLRGVS